MNLQERSIFVYGTLRQHGCRGACWPHWPLSIDPVETRGMLFDLGNYPAMRPGHDRVAGELWTIRSAHWTVTLRTLDEIEGYAKSDSDLYTREIVACHLADGSTQMAWTYLYASEIDDADRRRIQPNAAGICIWHET